VGQAKVTKGYRLQAAYVIHAVGPRWHNGRAGESTLLASCYRNSLELAATHGVASIAFPAISTGVYGYPLRLATETAVSAIIEFMVRTASPMRVVLATFDAAATQIAREVVGRQVGVM
jgi:O-acetyl-ADP-ribose deacetylase